MSATRNVDKRKAIIETHFTSLDWLILGGYFVIVAITGALLSRRQATTRDYFLGGGKIPAWAAAISLLSAALSGATFIGGPQQSYKGDLSYLIANIGSIIAVLIVAYYFVPMFYKNNDMTVYGILERKFGPPARLAAGSAYLLGRVFASGARLYIAALPASLIVFGDTKLDHLFFCIAVLTLVTIFYTLVGGIKSVIWTDVIQTAIFTGAACIAIVVLMQKIPLSLGEIVEVLKHPGGDTASKLTLFKLGFDGFDPKHAYTILTAIFGFSLLNLGAYGTDQDLAQKMLPCKSAVSGSRSAIGGILVGIPVTALFMVAGLLLYVFYRQPAAMGALAPTYQPEGSREVFLTFILREMPPGMPGLMLAGLFAAALGTGLNAMSSAFVHDFYQRFRPGRLDRHYINVGMLAVIGWGVILGLFAMVSAVWQEAHPGTTLIDFALSVMVFAYSGLVAVYLTALFTKRGSSASVVAALLVGFGSVVTMQSLFAKSIAFPWQMFIATGLAFAVAQVGKRSPSPHSRASGNPSGKTEN